MKKVSIIVISIGIVVGIILTLGFIAYQYNLGDLKSRLETKRVNLVEIVDLYDRGVSYKFPENTEFDGVNRLKIGEVIYQVIYREGEEGFPLEGSVIRKETETLSNGLILLKRYQDEKLVGLQLELEQEIPNLAVNKITTSLDSIGFSKSELTLWKKILSTVVIEK